jgi:uncharacterized membrane protein YtjA (UPF0391 family)
LPCACPRRWQRRLPLPDLGAEVGVVLRHIVRPADRSTARQTIESAEATPHTGTSASAAFNIIPSRSTTMLHYAVVFFVIALIAAVLGFTGIAASAAGIAKILFMLFLVLALVTFVYGMIKRS